MSSLSHDVVPADPSASAETPARSAFWCKCGRSFARPFCDGTHGGACACHDDHAETRVAAPRVP